MSQKQIARKLAKMSVAIAFIVGVLLSSIQVYRDFLQEEEALDQIINRILKVAEHPATASVHTLSEEQANEVVNGLLEYDFIQEAAVYDDLHLVLAKQKRTESKESKTQWLTDYISEQYKHYSINLYPIIVDVNTPGKLSIVVNVDTALSSFFSRSIIVFVSGIVRNVILALLLFFVFHSIITRPLIKLGQDFKKIKPEKLSSKLKPPLGHEEDEFNLLTQSANELIEENHKSIHECRARNVQIMESERRLKTLVETIPDLIWLKDPNGIYLSCNQHFERFFGAKEAEIVGKTDYDYVDKELADLFRSKDREAMDTKQTTSNEEEVVFADDGHKAILHTLKTPMLNNNGKLIGILGIARDITELKQAEMQVGQLRSYLSNIIDSMPSIIIGVDIAGFVTQWNSGAEKAMQLTKSQAVGQPLIEVFPRLKHEMVKVQEAISTRSQLRDTKRQYLQNDELVYEDVTIYPLISNGVEGAVIRVDDVSEQVRIEEMMIQSEKMLSVGGLAAGMAHEINNPLAGMMQTSDVMLSRLSKKDVVANQAAAESAGTTMDAIEKFMDQRGITRMLEAISDSGARVAGIVENMLSFARKSDEVYTTHNINEVIDKAIELSSTDYDLKKHYDFKAISIVKEYGDDIPVIGCDNTKIQQVLLNLFRNGAEAMQEAGVEHPEFRLHTFYDAELENVCIHVGDSGPGMDEKTSKRVFEPFFTTKPAGVGTGLGLSVSYFIITENHGGEMTVESELGVGTKFLISLPLDRNKE